VITHGDLINNNIKNVCGIDISYKDSNAFCSAMIVNKNTLEVIEIVNEKSTVIIHTFQAFLC
jgi:deoxyinosine 3'endonuclease (endonuclease V)